MKEKIELVKDILEKNNYYVSVYGCTNGFVVIFPNNIVIVNKIHSVSYVFNTQESEIEVTLETEEEEIKDVIKCPSYAQSQYAYHHLIKICDLISYSIDLIKYYNNGYEITEEEFMSLVDQNFSIEDKQLDMVLRQIISKYASEIISYEEALKLSEGYNTQEGFKALMGFLNEQT